MLYKYISKKFNELNIQPQFKQECTSILQKLANKQGERGEVSKADVIMKVCEKLIRLMQRSKQCQVEDGLAVLQFVRGLVIQVYEKNRIETYFIKIRAYLLAIRWNKSRKVPVEKQMPRINLFLQHIKSSCLFEAISSDYYSQVERLYLQVIEDSIRRNDLDECSKLIGICFQCFKNQMNVICSMFSMQESKISRIINSKLQLLSVLFQYQHAVKFITNILSPQEITQQILPKYEKITVKIPINHFPPPNLTADCESLWLARGCKTRRINTASSVKNSKSKTSINLKGGEQRSRQSLRQTILYLNDFFQKRSYSAQLKPHPPQQTTIKLPQLKSQVNELQKIQEGEFRSSKQKISFDVDKAVNKRQAGKERSKKFKLVINMERQARDKMIKLNPFESMTKDELNILAESKGRPGLVF